MKIKVGDWVRVNARYHVCEGQLVHVYDTEARDGLVRFIVNGYTSQAQARHLQVVPIVEALAELSKNHNEMIRNRRNELATAITNRPTVYEDSSGIVRRAVDLLMARDNPC